MPSKYIYSEHIPKEILPVIQEKLEKYSYLIPGWVQEVRVYWQSTPAKEEIVSGQSAASLAYRWAQIAICPGFLDEPDADKEDTIVHELTHILLWPLSNFYDHVFQYFDDQPEKVKDFMLAQLSERIEGATVDVTTAILKAVKGDAYAEGRGIPLVASGKKDIQPPVEHIFLGAANTDSKDSV
jgi:hypothetical protein